MSENLKDSWIYYLQNQDIIKYCNEFDVDSSGSYRQCRERFARFLNGKHKPLRMLRLLELQRKHSRDSTEVISPTKQLQEKIDRRYQRYDESFEHFACELQKLMQELNYSESRQFAILVRNSQPVFQHFLKRTHSSKLHELLTLAEDLEEIRDCMLEETRPRHTFKQLRYDASHIYATIYVCEIRAIATIDTGASRSFVSEDYVAKLGKRCRYVPVNADVTLADGSVRVLKFAVEGQVRMGNICCQFQFIIMPDASEDVILGLDFCMHVGATFSCGGETIQLENGVKAVVAPERELNAAEPIFDRKTTELRSVKRSSSSSEKRTGIEETATKSSLSSKRRREETRSHTDQNNSKPTPYPTRQRVHPMPLFANPYTGISSSSSQSQNINNNIEEPFNPTINFPEKQWSPHIDSCQESSFSNQQCANKSSWNDADINPSNYFLNRDRNGTGWNAADGLSGKNMRNENQTTPTWSGNEAFCENNSTRIKEDTFALNNTTALPPNRFSKNWSPNLSASQSSSSSCRDSIFGGPTPIRPLFKAEEKTPPPSNDFSNNDADIFTKFNTLVEQASKGINLLQEYSKFQTSDLFKILVNPNKQIDIMGMTESGANKNLNSAINASSTVSGTLKSARKLALPQTLKDKKSTLANPQQEKNSKQIASVIIHEDGTETQVPQTPTPQTLKDKKPTLANPQQEKNSKQIASVIIHEDGTETQVPQTPTLKTSRADVANVRVGRDTDDFPSVAKRQKINKTQAKASVKLYVPPLSFEPASLKALQAPLPVNKKTAANPKAHIIPTVTTPISTPRHTTIKPKPGIPTDMSFLKTKSQTDNQKHQPSQRSPLETFQNKQPVLEQIQKTEIETPAVSSEINAHIKKEAFPGPTASTDSTISTGSTAIINPPPPTNQPRSTKPTAPVTGNVPIYPIANPTEPSNNAALSNPTAPENPDAPNDFSMYDEETTKELRGIVAHCLEGIRGRRKKFIRRIGDQFFSVRVSRSKLIRIVPAIDIPAKLRLALTSSDALQNKQTSQATEEEKTSTEAMPESTEFEKACAQFGKIDHKVPQLDITRPTTQQRELVTKTDTLSNNSQVLTSLNVTHEIPCATPTVDVDLSMHDEETAAQQPELALDGATEEHSRNQAPGNNENKT